MASELIDQYIDRAAIADDTKFLQDQLKTVLDLFDKVNSIRVTLEGAKTLKQISTTVKEADSAVGELTTATKKLVEVDLQQAKAVAAQKLAIQQRNAELKNQAREQQAAAGSIEQMRAALIRLNKEYDNLSKVEREAAGGQKLLKDIQTLDAELKQLEGSSGRFQRNVGNYSGALKTLETALQEVKSKIDDFNKSGNQNTDTLEQLKKEEALLTQLLDNQATGFASVNAEIKANTLALHQMTAAGLEGTKAYNDLFEETAKLKDEASDLKKALTAAAPDDVAFQAAADSAKALVGVYGAAQSVTALFGNENKDLQQTLVKLQAAETALQSIEAIRAVFKKENAVRQAINIGLQKVEIAQTYLETQAESKNIVVKYAAIAAQRVLNFVTSAAGGPFLILLGLLATAIVSMAAYGDATEDAAAKNDRLNKSLERSNDAIEKGSRVIKQTGDKALASIEENFATEAELRKQREKNLEAELENTKRINALDLKNRQDTQKQIDDLLQKKFRKGSLGEDDQKIYDDAIKRRDGYLANVQKQDEQENQLAILQSQNRKATKEEEIKDQQTSIETLKSNLQTRINALARAAEDEKRTYEQRIKLLREIQRVQEEITNKDAKKQLLDPTLTKAQITQVETTRKNTILNSRGETIDKIQKLQEQADDRRRAALLSVLKTEVEDQAKAQEAIADNENKSFDQRTDALYAAYEKRRALTTAQYEFDIKNQKLTTEERKAIEIKYISDINQLTVDYGVKQLQIYKNNEEKVTQAIEKEIQKRQDKIATEQADTLLKLNESRRSGLTGVTEYEQKRAVIESKYRLESLQQEVAAATSKVISAKEGTAERAEAEKELKEKTLAYSDELIHNQQITDENRVANTKKTIETIGSLYQDLLGTISALSSIQADREKAQIDEQITNIDKKKDKEIEAVNNSVLSEQDKANRIAVINARADAQKDALDKKRRAAEIQKARFDKAANIANIITGTALAVVTTLADRTIVPGFLRIPLALAAGAIGAAQLAVAIATPLPKYKHGRADGPATLAIVGDGARPEVVYSPDMKEAFLTPAHDTLTFLPKDYGVAPSLEKFQETATSTMYKPLTSLPVQNNNDGLIHAMAYSIGRLERAVMSKQETHFHWNNGELQKAIKNGNTWIQYINSNI